MTVKAVSASDTALDTDSAYGPDTVGHPDGSSLLLLMTWLSPAFPTGAFSYSGGLESAADQGLIADSDDLKDWLDAQLRFGSIWNDLVLCAAAYQARAGGQGLQEVQDEAAAIAGSAERYHETLALGAAFRRAAAPWPAAVADDMAEAALPVAVGSAAAALGIVCADMLLAYGQSVVSNQIQAALRLAPIGQQRAVVLLRDLMPVITDMAAAAGDAGLDSLNAAAITADMAAMHHRRLSGRMFQS